MNCPKCLFENDENFDECLKCGVIFSQYERYMTDRKLSGFFKFKSSFEDEGFSFYFKLITWSIPILALVFAFLSHQKNTSVGDDELYVPKVNLSFNGTKGKSSCEGKEVCISVYLAPWCGSCKMSWPFIAKLRKSIENRSDVGIKLIVGSDSPENLFKYAKSLGGKVYIDSKDQFAKELGVTSVPTWIVWDEDRFIVNRQVGGFSDIVTNDNLDSVLVKKFSINTAELKRELASEIR